MKSLLVALWLGYFLFRGRDRSIKSTWYAVVCLCIYLLIYGLWFVVVSDFATAINRATLYRFSQRFVTGASL